MYVREQNGGSLGDLLQGIDLDEAYLLDPNNWISHNFLQVLYHRMIDLLGDPNAVYNMALSTERFESLGLIDRMIRIVGNPKLIYSQTPRYNKLLKLNGSVFVREVGPSWAVLEDRYHDGSRKTRFDCDYTRGMFAALPTMFGMPAADVEEMECQVSPVTYGTRTWPDDPLHSGNGCLYRVRWNPKDGPPVWKRFFRRRHFHRQAIKDLQHANQLIQSKYDEVKQLVVDLETANKQLTTSKKELEEQKAKLITSERRYRLLADNVNDVIWSLDMDMMFTYISPSVERLQGFTPQEIVNGNLRKLLTPESHQLVEDIFHTELDKHNKGLRPPEQSTTFEVELDCRDGSQKTAEVQANFVYDAGGNAIGVIGTTHDITERKRADNELRKSEERLRAIFQAAETVSFVITDGKDPEPLVLDFSRGAENIFGYAENEILHKPVSALHIPEDVEQFPEVHQRMKEGTPGFSGETTLVRKSGERFPALFSTYPLFDDKGRMYAVLGVGFDLSEQHKLEMQLRQAHKMESVGRLAGGVAHDFNNMLGIILGNTQLVLQQLEANNPLIDNMNEIRRAAERSAAFTGQLLAFARKQTVAPKVLNLNETLEGMLKMLARLIGENINLVWRPQESGLWPVEVDPSQIDQILANLCVNARDAITGVGDVTIETSNTRFHEEDCLGRKGFKPGDFVAILVRDNGCGMDEETIANIFEPFFTTKDVGRGTGLGLATVYGIVKQNGGFINVHSEKGQGTTFEVYLPRYMKKASHTIRDDSYRTVSRGHETILLVEDEEAILKMTKTILEHFGYHVLTASGPTEAIQAAESYTGEIELLLTDVVMPEMSGRDMAESLLSLYPNLKCLFMSGYTASVISSHGVLEKGIHFINKPFLIEDLAAKVREALDPQTTGE